MTSKGYVNDLFRQFEELNKKLDKANDTISRLSFTISIQTDEIKELIMNGKSSLEIRKEALKHSYKPLVVDGIRKIVQGYTTLDELNKKLLIY